MKLLFGLVLVAAVLAGSNLKNPVSSVVAKQIMAGFEAGLQANISNCIKNQHQIANELYNALTTLQSDSVIEIAEGISQIGKALKSVPHDLKKCSTDPTFKLPKYIRGAIKALINSTTIDIVAGEKIIVNGVSIYDEITAAKSDYQTNQFFDLGYNIGAIVKKMIPVHSEKVLKGLDFNQVIDIIGGVFLGIASDVQAPEIAPCVYNSDVFGGFIEQAVVDFSNNTFDGIKNGLMDLSNAFGALSGFVNTCVPAAVETGLLLEKITLAWAHPLSVLYHTGENILINGQEIFKDISLALGDYQTGEWEDFGFRIGQASFLVIYVPGGDYVAPLPEEVESIVKGIFLGLEEEINFESCLALPDVGEYFANSVKSIKLKTFGDTKTGLTSIGNALLALIPAIESCACENSVNLIRNAANVLIEPYSFAYPWGKDIVINGRSISKELKTALVNFYMKDWASFGRYLGKALLNLE